MYTTDRLTTEYERVSRSPCLQGEAAVRSDSVTGSPNAPEATSVRSWTTPHRQLRRGVELPFSLPSLLNRSKRRVRHALPALTAVATAVLLGLAVSGFAAGPPAQDQAEPPAGEHPASPTTPPPGAQPSPGAAPPPGSAPGPAAPPPEGRPEGPPEAPPGAPQQAPGQAPPMAPPEAATPPEPAPQPTDVRIEGDAASTTVPVERGDTMFLAPVRINDTEVGLFLINTGGNTAVSGQIAVRLGLPVVEDPRSEFGINPSRNQYRRVDSLKIGGAELGPMAVEVQDQDYYAEQFGAPVLGAIGVDVLGRLPFTLDPQSGELTLHDPEQFEPPDDANVQRTGFYGHHILLPIEIDREIEGLALLHSASPIGLQVHPSVASEHREFFANLRTQRRAQPTQPTVWVHSGKLDRLKVLGQSLDQAHFAYGHDVARREQREAPVAGMLAGRVLERLVLTIDAPNRRAWAEPIEQVPMADRIDSGLDVDDADHFGFTPLMRAARSGRLDDVIALLEAGAEPDSASHTGHTALAFAAEEGHRRVVEALLEHGADVAHHRELDGATALILAAAIAPEVVEKLLEADADVHADDDRGHSPLMEAARHGNSAAMRMLLAAGARIDDQNRMDQGALHMAALSGDIQSVRLLLSAGAELKHRDNRGQSPLMHAVASGNADLVRLLLDEGAQARQATHTGLTPLMHATQFGHRDIAALLIEHEADINAREQRGLTPLMLAAFHGYEGIAEMLIEAGADVDRTNTAGQTALHSALQRGHIDLARKLMEAGADVHIRDSNNRNALFAAIEAGSHEGVRMLVEAGVDVNQSSLQRRMTPLMLAALSGGEELARELLDAGARVDARDHTGRNAMFHAIATENLPPIEALLEAGIDINQPANDGSLPLHASVGLGLLDATRMLLEAGSDIEARAEDLGGMRPIDIAVMRSDLEMVQLLNEAGTDLERATLIHPQRPDAGPMTPLTMARLRGDRPMVELLQRLGAQQ